jgi:ferrous iron transport protein B
MAILGKLGIPAFIFTFGVLAFLEIAVGIFLNRVLPAGEASDFIQELPPIRRPSLKALVKKTWYRLYWFLKEAVPIFLIASVVLFTIDKLGVLSLLKAGIAPVIVHWLGLPIDMADALILTMVRQEAGSGLLLSFAESGALSPIQCVVAVLLTTMFVPCFANMVAICKEIGFWTGVLIYIVMTTSSIIFAGIIGKALTAFAGG